MAHNLFIVRHAQTHSGQHYNSDKERELIPEGITQATQLGKYLNALNYNVDLIISSDAVRAKTTALLIAAEIKYPAHQIQFDEKIYAGSLHEVLDLIQQTPESIEHILMIGHYPTIVEVNNYLSNTQKTIMETCELTLLNFDTQWSALLEGMGELKLNYHPPY